MNQEETIFAEAVVRAAGPQRAAFLDEACRGDGDLRARVEVLLAAHERVGSFLESPPPGIGITTLTGADRADAADPDPKGPAPAERSGTTVGRYTLLEQIGEGGMGVVYRAEQLRPVHREVALKIIKPGLDTRSVIARFEAERQALAIMDHPGIARVFDAGATAAGRPYFVMELVRGIPITDYCDRHQLSPRQRLELFVQVCQAVQHAHTKGIIHRDLKPSNVLITVVDGKPLPKVIDFGIAKATDGQRLTERTLYTESRQLVGTPLYMSPEQAELNAAADVDTRCDVYSLGVLLYELLTGTTPFDRQRLAKAAYDEVRRIIREEEPPRPSTRLSALADPTLTAISRHRQMAPKTLRQFVREELDWIVMKTLEKDRTRRYDTADGLARDVERYLADEPVEAHPPSRFYRLRKFARRNTMALSVAAVIALVLALGAAISTWQAVRATRAEQQLRRERDIALAEKDRADRAAHTAHNVSHFLQLFIADADLGAAARSPTELLRDMLDRFADRFDGQLNHDPAAEAALHNIVGWAYRNLNELDKAEAHLLRAVQLRRAASGPQDTEYAALLLRYADVIRQPQKRESEQLSEAEARVREALAVYRSAGMNDGILNALHLLKAILEQQRRYPEVSAVRQEWVATARQMSDVVVGLPRYLGDLAMEQSRFAEAEAHYRDWLELKQRQTSGDSDPWPWCALANALTAQRKYAEALQARREALRLYRQKHPPDHPSNGWCLDQITDVLRAARANGALATVFASVETIDEIAALYRQAPMIRPPAAGADHPAVAAARGLATLAHSCAVLHDELAVSDRAREAQRVRDSALELVRSIVDEVPRDPELFAAAFAELNNAQLRLGLLDDAKRVAYQLANSNIEYASVLDRSARHFANCPTPAHRDATLAVALAEAALRRQPQDPAIRGTLGTAYYRAGQYRRAITELRSAMTASVQPHLNAAQLFVLAMAHHQLGEHEAARESYESGVAAQTASEAGVRDHALQQLRVEAEQTLSLDVSTPSASPTTRPATPAPTSTLPVGLISSGSDPSAGLKLPASD